MNTVFGKIDHLTEAEQIDFLCCEAVLEMDSQSFVEKGRALALIRNNRLYRESGDYKGFEDYCQKRWQTAGTT